MDSQSTPPAICVASAHATISALLADAEYRALANKPGFLIELRLDYYDDLSRDTLQQALSVFAPNAVVTFRHPQEGGKRQGVSDDYRLGYLQLAAQHGVAYIDIEARTPRANFQKYGAKLMLSYHDFANAPTYAQLVPLWQRMRRQDGVDFVKIAVQPHSILETQPLLDLLRAEGRHTVLLGMGEAGLWTRVLAGKFGSPLSYARPEQGTGTAPGQLTWRQLQDTFRFHDIRPDWPIYGVIGNPIAHSLSPRMHNAALRELNLPGVYLPFKVDCTPLDFIRAFTPMGLRGISVTIPHKETVREACVELDSAASAIGAVNTLSWSGEQWTGTNTDAPAAADSLQEKLPSLSGKTVVVLGAGGAARAVVFGVKERGANVLVINRNPERAETLARELGATAIQLSALPEHNVDAIVNTTPLGMAPKSDGTPLEESQIPQSGLVFDTVYNPLRTKLLTLAEKRGCRTIEGVTMFVAQGVRQFELWTGHKAPRETMTRVVLEELQKRNASPSQILPAVK